MRNIETEEFRKGLNDLLQGDICQLVVSDAKMNEGGVLMRASGNFGNFIACEVELLNLGRKVVGKSGKLVVGEVEYLEIAHLGKNAVDLLYTYSLEIEGLEEIEEVVFNAVVLHQS